jgi:hypothetical protein
MKHSSETLAVGVFYHGRLAVTKDPDIQNPRDEGQTESDEQSTKYVEQNSKLWSITIVQSYALLWLQ